jgi:hypothetical protein
MRGMDGVRALLYLWVLAYQLNEFLALVRTNRKEQRR